MSDDKRYVWIVHYDNYGDTWISEVFDSEDKALAYEEKHDPAAERTSEFNRDYRIDRHVLL